MLRVSKVALVKNDLVAVDGRDVEIYQSQEFAGPDNNLANFVVVRRVVGFRKRAAGGGPTLRSGRVRLGKPL
jgi:hypothetical protein